MYTLKNDDYILSWGGLIQIDISRWHSSLSSDPPFMIKIKKINMTYGKRMSNQFLLLFINLIIRRLTKIAHKSVLKHLKTRKLPQGGPQTPDRFPPPLLTNSWSATDFIYESLLSQRMSTNISLYRLKWRYVKVPKEV